MGFEVDIVGSYQLAGDYGQNRKVGQTGTSSFHAALAAAGTENASSTQEYTEHLKSKYGNVVIQSVGKDQKSLDRIGMGMSGNSVVISPGILEQMSNNPEKAAYFEQKIDYFFESVVPRETASFASKGLIFEPGGVVVHDDGTVTSISGCRDSPERVAEVNAANKAKTEKKAAQRKENQEYGMEAAEKRKRMADDRSLEKMWMELSGSIPYVGNRLKRL